MGASTIPPRFLVEEQRLFSADEFKQMLELGLFADEHVELIRGRILMLMAQGPRHTGRVNWLATLFFERLAETYGPGQRKVAVQVQSNARTSERNMPEADLYLVPADKAFSGAVLEPGLDVYLAVEVADTTLKKDRDEKPAIYAADGVPLLWVLDLPNRLLHVFRNPDSEQGRYRMYQAMEAGETTIDTLPELPPFPVTSLFEGM